MTIQLSNSTHARETLVLGLPLIGSSLAQMALHVADTVMVGWYGVLPLAAVVLGADQGQGVLASRFETYSEGHDACVLEGGGTRYGGLRDAARLERLVEQRQQKYLNMRWQ